MTWNYETLCRIGTIRGYGETENGLEIQELLEANVTVISNEQCKKYLESNSTKKAVRRDINKALKNGLNYGFLCAQGIFTEDGRRTGACKVLYINKLYIVYIVHIVHTALYTTHCTPGRQWRTSYSGKQVCRGPRHSGWYRIRWSGLQYWDPRLVHQVLYTSLQGESEIRVELTRA